MLAGLIKTCKLFSNYLGSFKTLNHVLENGKVDDEFYIENTEIERWKVLKGSKKKLKVSKSGHQYLYTEGKISFPDPLDKPSRTIITSEGGKSPSRTRHVIKTKFGIRRLTPLELERLNEFPDNHTKVSSISNSKRSFLMGNALVIGVVKKIGNYLN